MCHRQKKREIGVDKEYSFCGQGMASGVIQVLDSPEKPQHRLFPWGRAEGILFAPA